MNRINTPSLLTLQNTALRVDRAVKRMESAGPYGIYLKRDDGTLENLATPIWHWGKFYEQMVRNIFSGGSTEADAQKGKKAVNYCFSLCRIRLL